MQFAARSIAGSLIAVGALAAGCSNASAGPDTGSSFDAATIDVSPVDAAIATDAPRDVIQRDRPPPPGCSMPDASSGTTACVRDVSGSVVDTHGAAVGNRIMTVCGSACFFGRTAADGTFDVMPGIDLDYSLYSIKVHGRPDHASLYVPMPTPVNGDVVLAAPLIVPLYTDVGAVIPSDGTAATITAGDLTLSIPAHATIDFDLEDYDLGALGHQLRVAAVTPGQAPDFAIVAGLVSVYALGPFDMASSLPIGLSLVNHTGLAAGTAIEFVVMGNDYFSMPPTSGHPVVAAVGHVSADGLTLNTDPGQGLNLITWVGVRPLR